MLILGGGFGGLYTAIGLEKTLAREPGVRVTLVNRENFSLFTPMLHEVAASDLDMTHVALNRSSGAGRFRVCDTLPIQPFNRGGGRRRFCGHRNRRGRQRFPA